MIHRIEELKARLSDVNKTLAMRDAEIAALKARISELETHAYALANTLAELINETVNCGRDCDMDRGKIDAAEKTIAAYRNFLVNKRSKG